MNHKFSQHIHQFHTFKKFQYWVVVLVVIVVIAAVACCGIFFYLPIDIVHVSAKCLHMLHWIVVCFMFNIDVASKVVGLVWVLDNSNGTVHQINDSCGRLQKLERKEIR